MHLNVKILNWKSAILWCWHDGEKKTKKKEKKEGNYLTDNDNSWVVYFFLSIFGIWAFDNGSAKKLQG